MDNKFDVGFARQQFDFFKSDLGREWAFFDNAGGTFACNCVVDKLTRFYHANKVQPYGDNALAAAAGEQMDNGRRIIARLLGLPKDTITIGPSTTQNVNTLSIACMAFLRTGDEIIVSEQDHESNIGAWERAARQTGATLLFWRVNPEDGELDLAELTALLTKRTKIVCVTHSSNIIGTVNPVPEIIRLGHDAGAKVIIDGVSYAPHNWPDIPSLGADAYCFSTYKTYGPHLGIMYTAPDFMDQLAPQCHFFNVQNPWARLDAAGPDHALIASLAGIGHYFGMLYDHHLGPSDKNLNLKASDMSKVMNQHELSLCDLLLEALTPLPVRVVGKSDIKGREANIALISQTHSAAFMASALAKKGIAAKNGHFYAFRLLKALGIDTGDGVLRLSFAHYNTKADTLRLIDALTAILESPA